MKYIKKLNINFDDWDEYNYETNDLNNFFYFNKFIKNPTLPNNSTVGLNRIKINKKNWNIFCNFINYNNINIYWINSNRHIQCNSYNEIAEEFEKEYPNINEKYIYIYIINKNNIFFRPYDEKEKNNFYKYYKFNTIKLI